MRSLHDRTDLGPRTGATPTAGAYSVWFCTLTARNRLDISASQWNTSPIYGKVGIAIGLKSLSVVGGPVVAVSELTPVGAGPIIIPKLVDHRAETQGSPNNQIRYCVPGFRG